MAEQVWAAVVGFPGYEVSNYGRIRVWRSGRPKLRKIQQRDKSGYLRINLAGAGTPSGRATRLIHTLVYEAFNGPRAGGMDIHHIDGDKYNNRPENLILLSPSDHVALHAQEGLLCQNRTANSTTLTCYKVLPNPRLRG